MRRYHSEILRPIVSLVFVTPFLLAYEVACIGFEATPVRTGVDQWIHQLLSVFGIGHVVVLPLVTILVLVLSHIAADDNLEINPRVLLGILGESTAVGLVLFMLATSWHMMTTDLVEADLLAAAGKVAPSDDRWWAGIFGYFGAGIYEETIFRLLLLSGFVFAFSHFFSEGKIAAICGIVVTSLLFAFLHYDLINPAGDPFDVASFTFRFMASVIFCVVFLCRGFGVVAGAHVAYDVLGVLN